MWSRAFSPVTDQVNVGFEVRHKEIDCASFASPHPSALLYFRPCDYSYFVDHLLDRLDCAIKLDFFCNEDFPEEKKKQNPAKMSLTNCRFYEDKYPEVDSFVMVNVKQVWIN